MTILSINTITKINRMCVGLSTTLDPFVVHFYMCVRHGT